MRLIRISTALLVTLLWTASCERRTAEVPSRPSAPRTPPPPAEPAAPSEPRTPPPQAETPKPAAPGPAAECRPSAATLCPADEAPLDPSLVAFRARLLDAVERKSESMLLPLLARDIRISFGDDNGGIEAFRKKWKPSSSESPLWNELEELLGLGGAFRQQGEIRMFWAPYVFVRWPEEVDSYMHLVAIRSGVALRERPDAAAPVLTTLDWQIVRATNRPPAEGWRQVRTEAGVEGWARSSEIRSPIDYRAGFRKVDGEWKMTVLVAGD